MRQKQCHAHLDPNTCTDELQAWRIANFDILIGCLPAAMPAEKLGLDYLRFGWVPWTQTIVARGGGSDFGNFAVGIPRFRQCLIAGLLDRLQEIGADGVQIDTPLEIADSWHMLALFAEMREALEANGYVLMVNIGDAVHFASRNPVCQSLVAMADYVHVEVYFDLANHTQTQWLTRFAHLGIILGLSKTVVAGLYGTPEAARARLVNMQAHPRLYWACKVNPSTWELIPE